MHKRKLIYIMSPARAGSTLLTYLLANHPDIATVGELKATAMGNIDEYTCSCGELILNCGFWQQLNEKMTSKGHSFDLWNFGTHYQSNNKLCSKLIGGTVKGQVYEFLRDSFLKLSPKCKSTFDSITQQNEAIIESICELQNKTVFLDDSKSPIRLRHFINSGIWDIYVINLIRDGKGVVTSYLKTTGYPISKAVSEWEHICNEIENTINLIDPSIVHTIHYEDICSNTDESLQKLCEFIGIAPFAQNLVLDKSDKHILGNSMRLKSTTEVTLDERWRTVMTGDILEYFEANVGDLNRKLGYTN